MLIHEILVYIGITGKKLDLNNRLFESQHPLSVFGIYGLNFDPYDITIYCTQISSDHLKNVEEVLIYYHKPLLNIKDMVWRKHKLENRSIYEICNKFPNNKQCKPLDSKVILNPLSFRYPW